MTKRKKHTMACIYDTTMYISTNNWEKRQLRTDKGIDYVIKDLNNKVKVWLVDNIKIYVNDTIYCEIR